MVGVGGASRVLALGALFVHLVFGLLGPLPAVAQASAEPDDELLVGLTAEGRSHVAEIHARAGGRAHRQIGFTGTQVVRVGRANAAAARAAYLADRRVRYVEPNARVRVAAIPTDPGFAQEWGLSRISAPTAWDTTKGSSETLVAVIDTGVDATHPDLRGQIAASANFSAAADVADRNGHGTHVAGTIAAAINGRGAIGVAPGARLLIARALDDAGVGTYAEVIEAINWASDQGASVINLSLAGAMQSQALADAVRSAQERGALVVAAAGNEASSTPTYPAALPGVLAVGATDRGDAPTTSTSFGPWVTLGAPGADVYSTLPNRAFGSLTGSSMAAAHVAGVAALALAVAPNAPPDALRSILVESSDRTGWSGIAFQAGRVNAARAVELARRRAASFPARPTGGAWRVVGSGTLRGATSASFSAGLTVAADGTATGLITFTDRSSRVRLRSTAITSVEAQAGRAIVLGTARLGSGDELSFRLALAERTASAPAHLTLDAVGAGQAPLHVDADLRSGSIRVGEIPGGRTSVGVTPTRTPVSGNGGGTVRAASAPTNPNYLRAQTIVLNGQSYWSALPGTPTGPATNLSANIKVAGSRVLINSAQSIFISTAVPADETWDIGGTWTFNVYTRASVVAPTLADAYVRASIYRIGADGSANLITTTDDAPTNNFQTTTWTLNTWSWSVPANTILQTGEQYGVQFFVDVISPAVYAGTAVNGQLRFDSTTQNSSFTTSIASAVPTATTTATATPTASPTLTPTPTYTPGGPTDTPTTTATVTPTPTVTETPVPSNYLHNTTTTAGGVTYVVVDSNPPSGTSVNFTASLNVSGPQNLKNASNRSIFVAPAVPAGESWDLAGTWNFTLYSAASAAGGTGFLRATLYQITTTGQAIQLAVSPQSSVNAVGSLTPVMVPLSILVPGDTLLAPGERWGVEFQVNMTGTRTGQAQLLVDNGATGSRVDGSIVILPSTATPTSTPTTTSTETLSPTTTTTATITPTPTITSTPTTTLTVTPTNTVGGATWTATLTATDTGTPTMTRTATSTRTATRTVTPTRTTTATPTNTATPANALHAAQVTVGTTPYFTINLNALGGTLTSLTASIASAGYVTLANGGVSIFASDPVPAGNSWDLGGTWTFTAHSRTSNIGGTGYLRAKLYRIDSSGTATLLYTTGQTSLDALSSTSSATPVTWTYTVPANTLIGAGERYGVAYELNVTAVVNGATALLDFDTSTRTSRVADVTTLVAFTATPTPTFSATATSSVTPTVTPGGQTATSTATSTPTVTSTPCPAGACDSFDRGTAATLGSATRGGTWLYSGGTHGLCADQACAQSVPSSGAYAIVSTGLVDQAASITLRQQAGRTGTAGLILRARSDFSRMVLIEYSVGGQLTIWRLQNTYWTALGSTNVGITAGSTAALGATAYGSTIAVTWNGATLAGLPSVTDTNDASGTYAGIYTGPYGTSADWPRLDDFLVVVPVGAPPTAPTATATGTVTSTPSAPTPTAWPTAASDSFNRADSTTSLGRADSGQVWQSDGSTWGICTGQACAYGPAASGNYTRLETNLSNQRVKVTIATRAVGAIGQAAIILRVTPDWNSQLLYVGLDNAGTLELWSLTNGTWALTNSTTIAGYSPTSSHVLEAWVKGTTLSVYLDNNTSTAVLTGTVPSPLASSTMAGIFADTTDSSANWPKFDNFSVQNNP